MACNPLSEVVEDGYIHMLERERESAILKGRCNSGTLHLRLMKCETFCFIMPNHHGVRHLIKVVLHKHVCLEKVCGCHLVHFTCSPTFIN